MNSQKQDRQWWEQRYGSHNKDIEPALAGFLSHRSVRKFSGKAVPKEVIEQLVAAAQSASTSSNLQLFSMISVQEPERRKRITELCSNQDQVKNSPWFFAICVDHFRLRETAASENLKTDGLDYTECFILSCVDASLAAERMVCAAEALGLGTCYIGALRNDPVGVSECLNLPQGVFGLFGLCIGYPAESLSMDVKPRLDQSFIWHEDTYNQGTDLSEFDLRMAGFYQETGQDPAVTWLMRSVRRLSIEYMTGREKLLGYLTSQGFLRR